MLKISRTYSFEIIQVYAPTSSKEEIDVEQKYEDITLAKKCQNKTFTILTSDFNAKETIMKTAHDTEATLD